MINDKEIYLRVLNDLPFMQEILKCCDEQADEFGFTMLRERINQERISVRVEEDRLQREQQERIRDYEKQMMNKDIE